MKTNLLYLQDSYLQKLIAEVEAVETNGQPALILNKTIFYAQGGGQPADHGTIVGPQGRLEVTHVSYNDGAPLHKGTLTGTFAAGDEVTLELNWERRYYHMQLHTAGHILDQAVRNVRQDIKGVDGDHGIGKRGFVAFDQPITTSQLEAIQTEVNRLIAQDLPIKNQMVTKADIIEQKIHVPFDLPENKELRITQIGEYVAMPDGGTHLKSTGELRPVTLTEVVEKKGLWRLHYEVQSPPGTQMANHLQDIAKTAAAPTQAILSALAPLEAQIAAMNNQFSQMLQAIPTQSILEIQTHFLGKKGEFNKLAKQLSTYDLETRKIAGQYLNSFKQQLEANLAAAQTNTKTTKWIDVTKPGIKPKVGHMHPVSQAMEEITHIFEHIGFTRVRYPEVDWDWYVFESLNMPPDHPARDEWETFFIDVPDTTKPTPYDPTNPRQRHPDLIGGKMVLTTHTSNGQVREMERLNKPPIRMINIARCYRRQQDATHTQMFHQFEGLVVDKGITIQHLKGTLDYFAEQFYGPGVKSRIRPFHFRFTEPSFEVDFSCHICHGTGKVDGRDDNGKVAKVKCKFCKSGWHEVGGAGMVHPNVLRAGGIDPDQYTGFAFGWGVERTYTLKPGLNIDDIRLLYSGDLRFLEQF